ncbi:hypothetical protein SAY86_011023 [Trapa natans]|uniref:Uncharacterized protein n=1 Tax=Trapa natans TaxID=22666 RepID=A0AAN7R3U6_TRANT|nr:hypothetical protein SAY86_011023 [Trapa natans]
MLTVPFFRELVMVKVVDPICTVVPISVSSLCRRNLKLSIFSQQDRAWKRSPQRGPHSKDNMVVGPHAPFTCTVYFPVVRSPKLINTVFMVSGFGSLN